jgi:hypothetical protein
VKSRHFHEELSGNAGLVVKYWFGRLGKLSEEAKIWVFSRQQQLLPVDSIEKGGLVRHSKD